MNPLHGIRAAEQFLARLQEAQATHLQESGIDRPQEILQALSDPRLITKKELEAAAAVRIAHLMSCVGPQTFAPVQPFGNTDCRLAHFRPDGKVPYSTEGHLDWQISVAALLAYQLQIHQVPQMNHLTLIDQLVAFSAEWEPEGIGHWRLVFYWHGYEHKERKFCFDPGYYEVSSAAPIEHDLFPFPDVILATSWSQYCYLGQGDSPASTKKIEDALSGPNTWVLVTDLPG